VIPATFTDFLTALAIPGWDTFAAMPLFAWIEGMFKKAHAAFTNSDVLINNGKLWLVLVGVVAIEMFTRKNWRQRYTSPNFRLDVLIYLFYYSGIYHFLIWNGMHHALIGLVNTYAPGLRMNLLHQLSPAVQLLALIVGFDFLAYWIHRLKHSNRYLWAFHTIHHSQTILTPMTTFRYHIVDELLFRVCMFIPFQVFGGDIKIWILADLFMAWMNGVQHSNLRWTYGRWGLVFTSPTYHRIHHSTDERLQNCNFAVMFSFWDDLFGTAERKAEYPIEVGLAGHPAPETLFGWLFYPFIHLARDIRRSAPLSRRLR
jgi:sterol desaturase/sphingolipid hydroxylase (fatty acid hydroxylase superfamily)